MHNKYSLTWTETQKEQCFNYIKVDLCVIKIGLPLWGLTQDRNIYIYTQTQHTYLAQQSTEAELKCTSGRQNRGGMRKEKGARVSFTNKTIYLVYCKQLASSNCCSKVKEKSIPKKEGGKKQATKFSENGFYLAWLLHITPPHPPKLGNTLVEQWQVWAVAYFKEK